MFDDSLVLTLDPSFKSTLFNSFALICRRWWCKILPFLCQSNPLNEVLLHSQKLYIIIVLVIACLLTSQHAFFKRALIVLQRNVFVQLSDHRRRRGQVVGCFYSNHLIVCQVVHSVSVSLMLALFENLKNFCTDFTFLCIVITHQDQTL